MRLLALTAALFFVTTAHARTDKKDYVVKTVEEDVVIQGSSAHNRIEREFQVTAQLTGIGPSLSGSTGLQFGLFLDRNSLVVFELTKGTLWSESSLSSSRTGSTYDITTNSLGVHYKKFTGNSFYYRIGGDYRTVNYDYQFVWTASPTDTRHFKGTSLAATFVIGNQWQWENFTLGCDWVGLTMPLTSSVSDRRVVSTDMDYDNKRVDDDIDLYTKNTSLNLLRFYLGASF